MFGCKLLFKLFILIILPISACKAYTLISVKDGDVTRNGEDITVWISPDIVVEQNATIKYHGITLAKAIIKSNLITLQNQISSTRYTLTVVSNNITLLVTEVSINENNALIEFDSNLFDEDYVYTLIVKYRDCPRDLASSHAIYTTIPPKGDCCSLTSFYLHGCEIRVTCANGYNANNIPIVRTCNDGIWSSDLPNCELNCARDADTKRIVSESNPPTGEGCSLNNYNYHGCYTQFECADGYHSKVSETSRHCRNGSWSGDLPNCLSNCQYIATDRHVITAFVSSGSSGSSSNEACSTKHYNWNSCVIKFSCVDNYHGDNMPITMRCSNGSWQYALPECKRNCPRDETVKQVIKIDEEPVGYECTQTNYNLHGCTTKFVCAENYNSANLPVVRNCTDGLWDALLPDCQKNCIRDVSSPQLVTSVHSYDSCSTAEDYNLHGCTSNVECVGGYNSPSFSRVRTCHKGQWIGDLPDCGKNCDSTLSSEHVLSTLFPPFGRGCNNESFSLHGCTVTFQCAEGFHAETPVITRTCYNGEWSKALPQCRANCNADASIAHSISATKEPIGLSCTTENYYLHGCISQFTCAFGYHANGTPLTRTCDNGNWDYELSECLADCPQDIQELHVVTGLNDLKKVGCSTKEYFFDGCQASFVCMNGFRLSEGLQTRTCNNGSWGDNLRDCIKTCPEVPNSVIVTSVGNCTTVDYNMVGCQMEFKCANGYHERGLPITRICSNGTWNNDIICEKNCENDVEDASSFEITAITGDGCTVEKYHMNGCTVELSCKANYTVTGNSTLSRSCDNGDWIGDVPYCYIARITPTPVNSAMVGLVLCFIGGSFLGGLILLLIIYVLLKYTDTFTETFLSPPYEKMEKTPEETTDLENLPEGIELEEINEKSKAKPSRTDQMVDSSIPQTKELNETIKSEMVSSDGSTKVSELGKLPENPPALAPQPQLSNNSDGKRILVTSTATNNVTPTVSNSKTAKPKPTAPTARLTPAAAARVISAITPGAKPTSSGAKRPPATSSDGTRSVAPPRRALSPGKAPPANTSARGRSPSKTVAPAGTRPKQPPPKQPGPPRTNTARTPVKQRSKSATPVRK